jgi:light-harvesting complex 1 alpha chain
MDRQPRSPFRTNAIVFSILGLVVALLIHFIVLSSPNYNWLDLPEGQTVIDSMNLAMVYVGSLL